MILIFDDNKYRAEECCKEFKDSLLPTISRRYDDFEYVTKPMLTILVCPSPENIEYYLKRLSEENTYAVVVLKRDERIKGLKTDIIVDSKAKASVEKIKKIIKDNFGYSFTSDIANNILFKEKNKSIYIFGTLLSLSKNEYEILRFLAYNRGKTFSYDEIIEYINLRNNIKSTSFYTYVSRINSKSLNEAREKIIICKKTGYQIVDVDTNFGNIPNEEELKLLRMYERIYLDKNKKMQ